MMVMCRRCLVRTVAATTALLIHPNFSGLAISQIMGNDEQIFPLILQDTASGASIPNSIFIPSYDPSSDVVDALSEFSKNSIITMMPGVKKPFIAQSPLGIFLSEAVLGTMDKSSLDLMIHDIDIASQTLDLDFGVGSAEYLADVQLPTLSDPDTGAMPDACSIGCNASVAQNPLDPGGLNLVVEGYEGWLLQGGRSAVESRAATSAELDAINIKDLDTWYVDVPILMDLNESISSQNKINSFLHELYGNILSSDVAIYSSESLQDGSEIKGVWIPAALMPKFSNEFLGVLDQLDSPNIENVRNLSATN